MLKSTIFLIVAFVLVSCAGLAQSPDATVTGTVVDPSTAAIPGAKVEVLSLATGVHRASETNREGSFVIPELAPGPYRIEVAKNGFKTVIREDVVLHVQDVVALNFTLPIGSTTQSVTVEGGAPLVNTQDASVSTVVDRNFADSLPLNGRTFQALIDLAPGVTSNSVAAINSGNSLGQFTVNGQRADANYWTVDGAGANIGTTPSFNPLTGIAGGVGAFNVLGGTSSLVSVDALQEFRLQTSTYAPEFGRTPGGQVSIVTRSGTNQFHGTIFDYFRNTVLDATDWFANRDGLPKAAEQQNDFGGVIGGPIIKNKTFFFFSYEGARVRQPRTVLTTVPDLAARQAAIPAMRPFMDAYPLPIPGVADVAPGIAPLNVTFSDPSTVDAYSLRIDHTLTKNVNVFGRYNYSPSSASQRAVSGGVNTVSPVTSTIKTLTLGATWTKSSYLVDDVRFNYSSSGGNTSSYMDTFAGGAIAPGDSLFPSPLSYKNAALLLITSFGTDMGYSEGENSENRQKQYNLVDTLTLQKNSHSLKFGVDYRHLSPLFGPVSYLVAPFFFDIGSLEAGTPSLTLVESFASIRLLFQNLGIFAQDTWRVNPRLTLTYGLRDDIDFRPTTESGPPLPALSGFSQTDFSHLALAPAGTPIYSTRFANIAPRIGVAYQLNQQQGRETVFRGGFGIFYDLSSTEASHSLGGYPFTASKFVSAPFPTPPSAAAPPASVPPDATQGILSGFDPHLRQPYTLEWSFAIEQGLGQAQTLTASYIGSSGRNLLATDVIPTPNANYRLAEAVNNAGFSSYDALQIQFQRRLARGLQALVSYTWSHSIDAGSYGAYASLGSPNVNRGDSDFDIRHNFSAALTYAIPELRNSFTQALSGGWSLENKIQVHSAPPVDILDWSAFGAIGVEGRPDVVSGQQLYLYGTQYPGGRALNPDAFTNVPYDPTTGFPLRQGTLARNSLRGFGLAQWDFAIHREFPIHEALKLQFRAEMFNVLNHPNFAPYNANFNFGDKYFGQSTQMLGQALSGGITGAGGLNPLYAVGGPRNIQLALKLIF